jgi:hypothetical protein
MSGPADHLERGSFNRICDRCGRKRKARDTALEWTGLMVCTDGCLEERHPQDFVKGVADQQGVPLPRPEGTDTFVTFLEWDDATKSYV